ncbi:hypothetical protein TH63_17275 [Rufibacter radiotolerans]|uniref:Uncharacterized protein n=1 Tax=Rufibacter radiotolerans TaxID=1379910 RepID=A0A0H4W971_9BACT|nr:hypothetical protein TH63_17275 [Rufibacter radiotolerans]
MTLDCLAICYKALLPTSSFNYILPFARLAFVTFLLDEKSNQKNQEPPNSLPLRQAGLHRGTTGQKPFVS